MKRRLLSYAFFGALAASVGYLLLVDYSEKLEKDVSSILPQSDSDTARIARQLIDDHQGRAVYLKVAGVADSDLEGIRVGKRVERLSGSEIIGSVVKIDSHTNFDALRVLGENRIRFLFPKWLLEKRNQYEAEQNSLIGFPEWAAKTAVAEMGEFLESPMAMELAQPELLDPLLLGINALLALEGAGASGSAEGTLTDSGQLYWLTLDASPFSPSTQERLKSLVLDLENEISRLDPRLSVSYGGLVKLAGASRERIQKDVYKINLLSIVGVIVMASLLAPSPWRLGWFIPSLIAGAVGALTVSFLVFDEVNIIVLIIGSILIGTTIDYSIHLTFREQNAESFPTEKLVWYACLSTVVGFSILLFAELALIRQIGVFVGSGLVVAFLMARILIRPISAGGKACTERSKTISATPSFLYGFSFLVILVGAVGFTQQEWDEDLRNLEAPDGDLVDNDLALRAEFGAMETGSVFITSGRSYLDVFQRESDLFKSANAEGFGYSKFLPSRAEVDLLRGHKDELPALISNLREEYSSEGYELEAFKPFFRSATQFVREAEYEDAIFETPVQRFADSLVGPMRGALGQTDEMRWGVSSLRIDENQALNLAHSIEHVTLFSKLAFLNQTLDRHRASLSRFGAIAMLSVAIVIVWAFGWRKGSIIVLYPIVGGGVAIGFCALLFPSLNMFHLIGCFLGGAIALDYSLFTIEARARGLAIPRSVWISAGTTNASFLALTVSAIPAVQGLGAMVALLSCSTLLLLISSQSVVRRFL